ncbi:MAG: hypothetical protein ABI321_10765 [Polyangia bacterium]
MSRHTVSVLLFSLALSLGACTNDAPAPGTTEAAGETESPADSPVKYKVLADTTDAKTNTVEYHALVAEGPKHDDVEKLLKYLYRHLETRHDSPPGTLVASVYSNETQYKTPPRSPIATVAQKPGEIGPTFDNKVPLEFWQQVDEALSHDDKTWKLQKKIARNDAAKSLALTLPYVEPGKDEWAETLSFNQAMNIFTDTAQQLFEKVPELSSFTYVGTWSAACKDHSAACPAEDVVKISLDRETYHSLKLNELDESVGQIHGRAYLELSGGKGSDAAISKANAGRMSALYRKMLAQLKGKAWVSPKLK